MNGAPNMHRGSPADHGAQGLKRGILTMAHGKPRYARMAKVLAESLRRHCDHLPRAVITDSEDPDLERLFHLRIPFRPEYGRGLQQKLYLDAYSPFDGTLFIDADCLVVRDLDTIWPLLSRHPVGVVGRPQRDGFWFGDIATIRSHFGLGAIPRLNSGTLFFDKSERAHSVFATARELMERYEELGFTPMLSGGRNDEPVLAFAMAINGIPAIDDGGAAMRTPIGIRGPLSIDVLRGRCRFNKEGTNVEPAIAHFCGWRVHGFHYRRERLKLHLAERIPVPASLISLTVDGLVNPPYAMAALLGRPVFRLVERRYKQRKSKASGRTQGS